MNKNDAFYLEDRFIESPIFDNWFKKHYPQKSLLICTPYIKKDAVDRVIELYKLNERDTDFDLRILIRGNSAEFASQKSSDISALDSLVNLRCVKRSSIRRVQSLHMKAYLIDDTYLLITSGNLTHNGMFVVSGKENFEGGISSCNAQITIPFMKYFNNIWQQGQELSCFYDEFVQAYTKYIENEYSEKSTIRTLNRKKYAFQSKSSLDRGTPSYVKNKEYKEFCNKQANTSAPSFGQMLDQSSSHTPDFEDVTFQSFSLRDIPPVGSLEHLPEILRIVNAHFAGISYLDLGKLLRKQFGDGKSDANGANRKFGEEKGKFAAFFGLVSIVDSPQGKLVVQNKLGLEYMAMSHENRGKMIKDIFFDKPIVMSLMRKSLETDSFDLLQFLIEHCEGASSTLARKVGPLKELFSHISTICTEAELQEAMQRV